MKKRKGKAYIGLKVEPELKMQMQVEARKLNRSLSNFIVQLFHEWKESENVEFVSTPE